MIKISFVTGTRADFGLMKDILKAIYDDPLFTLSVYATGMHLMNDFGNTIDEVLKNFPHTKIIDAIYEHDDRASMANFIGKCLVKINSEYIQNKPDVVLVLGDRGEQLASCVAAKYLNIPIIHLHGGEVSGTVDNSIRLAISSLSDYHFAATEKSAQNLKKLAIPDNKIFVTGAPGLDKIVKLPPRKTKRQIVVLQHPAENEFAADNQIKITLEAVLTFNLPIYVIFPNADAGGRKMIKAIKDLASQNKLIKIFKSLPRSDFLSLLSESAVLVGNSSAGIIESASLKIPVVDIGERQKNRERGINVLHVGYNKEEISLAIKKAIDDIDLIEKINSMRNPYGDRSTSKRVIKLLKLITNHE